MISYYYLYDKIVQPVIDGHIAEGLERGIAIGEEQGEARGIAIGEERGEARMHAQFVEWLARKEEAEHQGLPFDEPMPGAAPSPNGHSPQR